MSKKNLIKKVNQLRLESEAQWDACGEDERFQSGLAGQEFEDSRESWEDSWDEAESFLAEGDFKSALESLEICRSLEDAYGDDSAARAVIELVQEVA